MSLSKIYSNVLPCIVVICALVWVGVANALSIGTLHSDTDNGIELVPVRESQPETGLNCIHIADGYVCGTIEAIAKAAAYTGPWYKAEEVKQAPSVKKITVRLTKYSPKDSCHYPAPGGGCYSANWPKKIAVGDFACPSEFKFGTKALFPDGIVRTCNDRPAKWLAKKWPQTPTFDVYVEDCSKGQCGMAIAEVTIIE